MENAVFALVLGGLALAERIPRLRFAPLPLLRPHWRTDVVCLATGVVALGLALRSAASALVGTVGPVAGGLARLESVPLVAAAIVLYDLGGYASHWMMHRYEPLWRIHQVHHSSLRLDWLATFRAHVLEHALRHLLSPVALLAIGFPAATVAIAGAGYAGWAALGHSNLRWRPGAVEAWLVTPRLHRLHHVPATSEANLGTILAVWDRLRGTLVRDPEARLEPVGVPGELASYPQDWAAQLVRPFRSRRAWRPRAAA